MKTLVLQITKHRLATQFQMERIYLKWLDNVCGKQYDTFLISKTNLSIKYGVLTMENSISDVIDNLEINVTRSCSPRENEPRHLSKSYINNLFATLAKSVT